ncbi:hypothetical protein GTQ40_07895 [Flavobacteriaceae bacterium R38]|nr:hypothetical protein [Flavobacteriaceae bacterium R38]
MKRFKAFIKKIFKQRKATVFMFFILFSSILWFLIKFSDSYNGQIYFKINYVNIPEDKILLGDPPVKLSAIARAQGFQILSYRLFKKELDLDVSELKDISGKSYFSDDYLKEAIQEVIAKNISIQQITSETFYLNFGKNKKKVIPVVHQLGMNFADDFELNDSLIINPREITVIGPEDAVDTISHLKTKKVFLKNINSDIDIATELMIPEALKHLNFNTEKIQISGRVERFSERLIKIPVVVTNVPEGTIVNVFPREISLLCRATIQNISTIKIEDFTITCDFNEINSTTNYLIPRILKKPSIIKEATLIDKKIEYLIRREE